MRLWPVVLVAALALGACGGGDADPAPTATTSAASAPAPAGATLPPGKVDPLAITSFTCRATGKGAWVAKGVLKNSQEKASDYVVSVFIGEQAGPARSLELDAVQGGKSVPFSLDPIVASPEGPCHLQALSVS